jgi:hypothetical protein
MMKRFPVFIACLLLVACGGNKLAQSVPPGTYGLFVGLGPIAEGELVEEAVAHLVDVYPPKGNHLDFQQRIAADESFGKLLLVAAQRNGYFVRQANDERPPQCGHEIEKTPGPIRIVPVCYLVDDISGLTRLTLYTAGESWSRLYEDKAGRLTPASSWTRRKSK